MRQQTTRRGAALLATLITLGVVSAFMVAITWQIVANRRVLDQRHDRLQAELLAQAGVELAAAHLLSDAAYRGATTEALPLAKIKISVERLKEREDTYVITSEARYPADAPAPVVRKQTRQFRRVMEGDKVRLIPVEKE
jgi:type II secretory pathway component PulK